MYKILIADKLNKEAEDVFSNNGIQTIVKTGLDAKSLIQELKNCDGLVVRSATKVTKEIIEASEKLSVIGRAGIGVDNIDIKAATNNGKIVMNAPFGNSITTAEHAITLILCTARQIPYADRTTHEGKWEKSLFTGTELYSKVLGMIGCGNIGSIVADRAQGLKMQVKVYDPFLTDDRAKEIGVQKLNFDELLKVSDFLTLHVPLTNSTKNIINSNSLRKMKKGSKIINCARGGLVNENDLAKYIKKGHISGAAFDVFSKEPAIDNPLFGLKEVVLTPHLGASTTEAQENVSVQIAEQMSQYLISGAVSNALNIPSVTAEEVPKLKPYMKLAEQIGKLAGQITETSIKKIKIEFIGQVAFLNTKPLASVLIAGLLAPSLEAVNMVNAAVIAKSRNMELTTSIREKSGDYITEINLLVETERRKREVAGTLYGEQPRIVRVMGTRIEAELGKNMLFITNEDKPGLIGELGTILANSQINIATFHLGRTKIGGDAIALIEVDEPVSQKTISALETIPQVKSVKSLTFEPNII